MGSCLTSHEGRLSKLEHKFSVMNTTTIQNAQSLSLGAQAESGGMDALVTQHESIIPRLNHEVEISSQRVNTVIYSVEKKIGE